MEDETAVDGEHEARGAGCTRNRGIHRMEARATPELPGHRMGWKPFEGIKMDVRNRWPYYKSDWKQGFNASYRILAPATYVFFANVIPSLAFGQQLSDGTDGELNGVNVLTASAMAGFLQSIFGGQPLLIIGVAEPLVLVYKFIYTFCNDNDVDYQAFATVTLFWAGGMMAVMAILNTCKYIHRFSRFSGEIFGLLIAVLFAQQAIVGLVDEFKIDDNSSADAQEYSWRLFNGVWSIVLAMGLLLTSLLCVQARGWPFYKGFIRRFVAEYGMAVMVLVWSLVAYIPTGRPSGIPRTLDFPDLFDTGESWTVITRLNNLATWQIFAAMVPGFIITVLYFFDHNVSSQLGQQKDFGLKKPHAYHYDFLLLSLYTWFSGLLGILPANGSLPQSPMHTRACAVLKKDAVKNEALMEEMIEHGEHHGHTYRGKMPKRGSRVALVVMDQEKMESPPSPPEDDKPFFIREQRLSGLLQSLLMGACLFLYPVLQKIPRSVLWGYFLFMAIESLPGNQFWERTLLLITDPKKRHNVLKAPHMAFLETVPMKTIIYFTLLQLLALGICYGITWAGVAGIVFPVFIMALVPVREYILPRFFSRRDLQELDALEYEVIAGMTEADEGFDTVLSAMGEDEVEPETVQEVLDGEIRPGFRAQFAHSLQRSDIRRRRASFELERRNSADL